MRAAVAASWRLARGGVCPAARPSLSAAPTMLPHSKRARGLPSSSLCLQGGGGQASWRGTPFLSWGTEQLHSSTVRCVLLEGRGAPATGGRCPKACLEEAGMSVTYDRRGCQTQSHFPAFYRVAAESEHVA